MTPQDRVFKNVSQIYYPVHYQEVEKRAAEVLSMRLGIPATPNPSVSPEGLFVGINTSIKEDIPSPKNPGLPWTYLHIANEGGGILTASAPPLLYAFAQSLDHLQPDQIELISDGLMVESGFSWNRPLFDSCLNQVARTARGFTPETYIEKLARNGFTHLEVNGLAMHLAYEPRVADEYYSQFYSYGPGLLQFVDSTLTRGLYDPSLLQANLQRMKRVAAIGRAYGLKPGMFCFEPRTLPERFFQRYPTLRGARVDHPLRSYLPRYTLAQDHPVVRDHYQELIRNLMKEIPDLAYLSVWTNDSGSGFEHTASLYAGRNGGPYIIREWRTHEQIARAAGESAVRWLRLIRDTGSATNPDFEVSLRIESFRSEHKTILDGLGNGLTVETPSLLVHGYDLPYSHPKLPENKGIAGTMFHLNMDPEEEETLHAYRDLGIEPSLHYAPGSTFNMEPLLGIPYPGMLFSRLQSLYKTGVRRINAIGGLLHQDKTPFWPNPHIIRAFQLNPSFDLEGLLQRIATKWAGPTYTENLIHAWALAEDALSYMPYVPLFSNFGFVWYRLWIRPFVPDIEAIPEHERAYYERFMVTMPNNPNMNDLGKDVLFELVTESSGAYMTAAFDNNVAPRFEKVLNYLNTVLSEVDEPTQRVFLDLEVRIRAAKIWATTLRNLCSWVTNVYGYQRTESQAEKASFNNELQKTIDKDIENTTALLELWTQSPVEFMLIAEPGETSYIYGENFGEHLKLKVELTDKYRHHTPYIDRNIIWRIPPNMASFNR